MRQILWKVKKKLTAVNNEIRAQGSDSKDVVLVPYHLKNINVVKKVAKDMNKRIATERGTTIFNAVRNDKDPLTKLEQKGVYRIPIMEEGVNNKKAYVGVTTRKLHKRLDEHKKDIAQARLTTSLAKVAYDKNIKIVWEEAEIIKKVLKWTQPTIVESLEILKRKVKEGLINDKLAWKPL